MATSTLLLALTSLALILALPVASLRLHARPGSVVSVKEDLEVGADVPDLFICVDEEVPERPPLRIQGGRVGASFFRVQRHNGTCWTLLLAKRLDYEQRKFDDSNSIQQLTLQLDGLSGSVAPPLITITIFIEDVNDNPPNFVDTPSRVDVSETASMNTVLFTVRTEDPDSATAAIAAYSLINAYENTFNITAKTCRDSRCQANVILVKPLDYDRQSEYRLSILATDNVRGAANRRVNSVTWDVLVRVVDEQTRPPRFVSSARPPPVAEDVAPGSRFFRTRAVDGDSGAHTPSRIAYRILGDSPFVGVDESSGWLFTKRPLDRESSEIRANGGFIRVTVEAREVAADATAVVNQSLIIEIADVDDWRPRCQQSAYSAEIAENSAATTPLRWLNASQLLIVDRDQIEHAAFDISLEGPNASLFAVFPTTGAVTLPLAIQVKQFAIIDYEIDRTLQFRVKVTPRAADSPHSASYCSVVVRVLDTNDNTPRFNQSEFNATVDENLPSGSLVSVCQATDADSAAFGPLSYRLTGVGAASFTVDSAGSVRTARRLDREAAADYDLALTVADAGGRSVGARLLVHVRDANDKAPRFDRAVYTAFLLEETVRFTNAPDGLLVSVRRSVCTLVHCPVDMKATDADDGLNGLVSYRLEGSDKFAIDAATGRVRVIAPDVDRELMSSDHFNLTLVATDGGFPDPLSSTAVLLIYVNDSNDNSPVFEHAVYNFSIYENATSGSTVGLVSATDADRSQTNSRISFALVGNQQSFVIDAQTGRISVADNRLFADRRQLEVDVVGADGGLPPRSATCRVVVAVVDINDRAPTFPERVYGVSVSEWAPPLTSLLNLTAFDADVSSRLRFDMAEFAQALRPDGAPVDALSYDYTALFDLDHDTGQLLLSKSVDRERLSSLMLTVTVTDLNAELNLPQRSTASVEITIIDENDNAPIFEQSSYFGSVRENSALGTRVLNVKAVDTDTSGGLLIYSIVSSSAPALLSIDQSNGEIRVAQAIDYELVRAINLTVRASDSGTPALSAEVSVTVRVEDENDNSPHFDKSRYSTALAEDAPVGTLLLHVTATDRDSAAVGSIAYSLLGHSDASTPFVIDGRSGALSLSAPIDRERRSSYSLTVRAVDSSAAERSGHVAHEATAVVALGRPSLSARTPPLEVTVAVADVNDNAPRFDRAAPRALSLSETDSSDTLVGTYSATDADEAGSPNSQLRYFIVGGNASRADGTMFALDSLSGRLRLAKDLRGAAGMYALVVEARDLGAPSLSTNLTTVVTVRDFNDHAPIIYEPVARAEYRIPENNRSLSRPILRVRALDMDEGANAQLTFTLRQRAPDDDWKLFRVGERTGELFATQAVDAEESVRYALTIAACDRGTPPQCAEVEFFVKVGDVNDNCPLFRQRQHSLAIAENIDTSGGFVDVGEIVAATDADVSANHSRVCYEIVQRRPSNAPFFLRSNQSTTLSTNLSLDREKTPSYELTVRALDCDAALPCAARPEALLAVRVNVSDENDNLPKFTQAQFGGGGVRGDTKLGTRVTRVQATDADTLDAGKLRYAIKGEIRSTLTRGKLPAGKPALRVNATTGDVLTNMVFEPTWKGSLHFVVAVVDTADHSDLATVTITLLSVDEQVELQFSLSPDELWHRAAEITALLSTITESNATIDDVRFAESVPGSETAVLVIVHFADDDQKVKPVQSALRLLDFPATEEQRLAKERLMRVHRLRYASPNAVTTERSLEVDVLTALAGVSGGLLLVMLVLLAVWCLQSRRYRRKLRAATTLSTGCAAVSAPFYAVPGSNAHASTKSEWQTSRKYDDVRIDDDDDCPSRNSLDDNDVAPAAVLTNGGMTGGRGFATRLHHGPPLVYRNGARQLGAHWNGTSPRADYPADIIGTLQSTEL